MRSLVLIGLLALGPGPAWAATAAKAPRAVAPKAAAAPRAAKPPAPQGPFDARDPASLIALLASMDAHASVAERAQTDVKLNVTTPGFSFGAQYVGCAANGKGCQALAFSTSSDRQRATLAQINAFNQTSITCRLFMDKGGQPHVVYSTVLSNTDTREEMRTHLGVWQGCLASFGAFLGDPNGYLASAP
ncbi:YbjN domain-containing protein [Phenylobacterium sp.]|jgi:hypothetical protein|uniref:YbjN domain-containing protein n=1 Tax=Phenylobacterium sp. TaxID=1871053 RepID=UPI002F41E4D2